MGPRRVSKTRRCLMIGRAKADCKCIRSCFCAGVFVAFIAGFLCLGSFDRWLGTLEMPVKKTEPAPHRVMNRRLLPQPFDDGGRLVELAIADAPKVPLVDPQDVSRQRFLEHVPVVV